MTYSFIKDNIDQNMIKDVGEYIWTPDVVFFVKSDPHKLIVIDHKVTIEKFGNISLSGGMDLLEANETYSGKENPLTLTSTYKGDFVCTFNGMYSYPFDQEHCQVDFYLSGKAKFQSLLFPFKITNHGPDYVAQYAVNIYI